MADKEELLDSENETTEEVDKTASEHSEDIEDTSADEDSEDVGILKEKNKKLFERTKKAEAELKKFKTLKPKEQSASGAQQQPQQSDIDELVNQKLEERDLESMDYPDEIKADIKKISKAQGISVRQAAKDQYIQYKLDEHNRAQKAEDAAPRTKGKGTSVKFDANNPPNPDMSTEAGRKEWDEYTAWLAKQGQ